MLANKQLRWWWNNSHQAIYDDGDGTGWSPHGPNTEWNPQSKSITFAEYGFASCDRSTNQPNVFFDPASSESFTAYWSIWDPSQSIAGGYWPRRDDELALLALQAIYEYWVTDGNNETLGERRADDPGRVHVGLELGCAAVSDFSESDNGVGRHRRIGRPGSGSTAKGRSSRSRCRTIRRRPGRTRLFRLFRR